jgi:hypothetical protein
MQKYDSSARREKENVDNKAAVLNKSNNQKFGMNPNSLIFALHFWVVDRSSLIDDRWSMTDGRR